MNRSKRTWCFIGISLVLFLSAVLLPAQAVEEEPQEPVTDEEATPPEDTEQEPTPSTTETFNPTEEIPADQAVDFPSDI
ncbi:MAG: hypothetical protein AB3N64_12130 [Puniceicoccaceae bacterium]